MSAPSGLYDRLKRAFDFGAAVVGVGLLAPLLAVIAVAVKVDSPGPALYLGRRIGLNGRPFRIMKFRTMNADAERTGTTTAKKDPRVTRVGRVLRAYKLDELPQLFNVLRGDMSLVGPRPEVEEHTREYDDRERLILTVRPGITDYSSLRFFNLAEVLGEENAHDVYLTRIRAQKNALRLEYVVRRSFIEDLRILLMTAVALARAPFRRKEQP